jgi:general secretion pathway protein H
VVERSYWLDARRKQAIRPISSKVSVIGAESERLSENQIGIRFFADGSATGGDIELSLADQLFSIEIDWLTGLARIQQ